MATTKRPPSIVSLSSYAPTICECCAARGLQPKAEKLFEVLYQNHIKRAENILNNMMSLLQNSLVSKMCINDGDDCISDNKSSYKVFTPVMNDGPFDEAGLTFEQLKQLNIDKCCMCEMLSYVPFDHLSSVYDRADSVNPCDFGTSGITTYSKEENDDPSQPMIYNIYGTSSNYNI